ncbi:DUF3078 domain-containing protein, partial [Bacteroidota bacterium]
ILIVLIFTALFNIQILRSQESDTLNEQSGFLNSFKTGGYASIIFNQISFLHWAKGGENSISATGLLNLFANMKEEKFVWENTLDFKYGLQNTDEFGLRTNQDVIDISSKFGFKALDQFYYTGLLSFKTQFAPGYNYPIDSIVVSRFFSPAYLIVSLGMDFKPNDDFSLYISPMTGKFIYVTDVGIANIGTYTSEPAKKDTSGNIIKQGNTLKSDFGAYLRINYKTELMENITLKTKFEIFNNYSDKIIKNRRNFDIDSETSIVMKVNELISANFFLHLIYDDDTKVPLYEYLDGKKIQVGSGPRLQLQEVLGIGVSYYFK